MYDFALELSGEIIPSGVVSHAAALRARRAFFRVEGTFDEFYERLH